MKALIIHSIFSDENFQYLNWFMQVVEMSDNPDELIDNIKENNLELGLLNTDCKVKVYSNKVNFYEYLTNEEKILIATIPFAKEFLNLKID